MAKDKQKLLLVQSLRGIAALIVLIHHGAGIGKKYLNYEYLNNIFSAGWLGVDFFFVLSGFIIYYVHHKDIGQKQRLKQFYLKRFLRVYPIYWIMTIVLVTLFFLVPSWGIGYETKLNVIIKSILLLPQSHDPIVNVGWSLVYEVFFYAVFGLIILLKPKYSTTLVSLWIVGVILNSIGIINLKNNLFLNFIFSNYDLEFFFGCIVGHLVLKTSIKYNYIILLVGVLGFLSGWYLVLQGVLMRYHTQAMLVLGISCGLIVLSATFLDLKYKLRVPKLLLLIGDASYSIYLTHFYIFVFIFKILAKVNRLNPFGGFITVSISLIIAVILGVTFHLVIERLLLKYLNGKLFNNMNSKQDQNYRKAI